MRDLKSIEINKYGRDYILEELALLEGCVAEGLGFLNSSNEGQNPAQKEPLFIVYPGVEENAFIEGKRQLTRFNTITNPYKFDVRWLELSIHDDLDVPHIADGQAELERPQRARFIKNNMVQSLLKSKTKNLLFLISIGKSYHEGECLEATINLFKNCISGCVSILKERETQSELDLSKNEKTKNLLEKANGEWRITVAVADTLQAYNNVETEEQRNAATLQYRKKGAEWMSKARPLFSQLEKAGEGIINVTVNIGNWESLLAQAKREYDFDAKYRYLLDTFISPALTSEAIDFQIAVIDKRISYLGRVQKRLEKDNSSTNNNSEVNINNGSMSELKMTRESAVTPVRVDKVNEMIGYSDNSKSISAEFLRRQNAIYKAIASGSSPDVINMKSTLCNNRFNLPQLNDAFSIVRQDLLGNLANYFSEPPAPNKRVIVSCYGPGGAGKSHLSVYYAERSQHAYTYIIRLDGSTKNRIENDLIHLAQQLGLDDKNQRTRELLNKLKEWFKQTKNTGWIIIVEDVDNYDDIKQLLPDSGGHILITSRKKIEQNDNLKVIEVAAMKEDEAVSLLRCYRNKDVDIKELIGLAQKIGYFPLALEMCGIFLYQHPEISIDEYALLFNEHFPELFGNKELVRGNSVSKNNPVTMIFKASLRRIEAEDKIKKRESLADKLLLMLSYLAPFDIPCYLAEKWLDKQFPEKITEEPQLFVRLRQQLVSHSLIIFNQEKTTISMSKILQDAVRYEMPAATHYEYIKTLGEVLSDSYPLERVNEPEFNPIKKRLLPHLDAVIKNISQQQQYYYANKTFDTYGDAMRALSEVSFKIGRCANDVNIINAIEREGEEIERLGVRGMLEQIQLLQRRFNLNPKAGLDSLAKHGIDANLLVKEAFETVKTPDGVLKINLLFSQFAKMIKNMVTKWGEISQSKEGEMIKQFADSLTAFTGKMTSVVEEKNKWFEERKRIAHAAEAKFQELHDGDPNKKELSAQEYSANKSEEQRNSQSATPSTNHNLFSEIDNFYAQVLQNMARRNENGERKPSPSLPPSSNSFLSMLDRLVEITEILPPSASQAQLAEVNAAIEEFKNDYGEGDSATSRNRNNLTMPSLNKLRELIARVPGFGSPTLMASLDKFQKSLETNSGNNTSEQRESRHETVSATDDIIEVTKPRKGLQEEDQVKILLSKQLPMDFVLGKAIDDGGCFFDAMAQIINKNNKTNINTEKYLRMLCHDFYTKNKALVDTWNNGEYAGIDKGKEDYYFIQYTTEECQKKFHGRAPIWGRSYVEGKILCRELKLKGICIIELLEDPDKKQLILTYYLANADDYINMTAETAKEWLRNPDVPTLVVTQKSLHFIPLFKNKVIPVSASTREINGRSSSGENGENIPSAAVNMFRGIFNKPASAQPRDPLAPLLAKYKLADNSQTSLEAGLWHAAANGFADDLKIFISHVNNINAQDKNPKSRRTALHWATINGESSCVRLLIAAGAKMNILDAGGLTAVNCVDQILQRYKEYELISGVLREQILEQTLNEMNFENGVQPTSSASP